MEMESRRKPFTKINKFMDSQKTQDHNIEKNAGNVVRLWQLTLNFAQHAKWI